MRRSLSSWGGSLFAYPWIIDVIIRCVRVCGGHWCMIILMQAGGIIWIGWSGGQHAVVWYYGCISNMILTLVGFFFKWSVCVPRACQSASQPSSACFCRRVAAVFSVAERTSRRRWAFFRGCYTTAAVTILGRQTKAATRRRFWPPPCCSHSSLSPPSPSRPASASACWPRLAFTGGRRSVSETMLCWGPPDRKCPRNGRNACKQQLPKTSEMKAKSGEKNKTENDHKRVFSDTKYACSIFFPSLLKMKIKTLTMFIRNVCNFCKIEGS